MILERFAALLYWVGEVRRGGYPEHGGGGETGTPICQITRRHSPEGCVVDTTEKELKTSEKARCFKCAIYSNISIISETFRLKLSGISHCLFAVQ